jgi:outer membrane protein OmpA-like peptidoglycan-associated protein
MERKPINIAITTVSALTLMVGLSGCGANLSETQQGAAIGAGAGVLAGGLEAESILAGGAVGALAGAAVGEYMNDQEFEIEEDIDSWVERPRENAITVNFRESQIFDPMSTELTAEGQREFNELADILTRYDATAVVVRAWADEADLADTRAERVEDFLKSEGISNARVESVGYRTDQPGVVSVLLMAHPG